MNTKVSLLRRIAISVLGVAFVAALVLALTLSGAAARADSGRYDVTSTVRSISDGVTETQYYTNTQTNDDQVVTYSIDIDLSKNTLIAGYKDYDSARGSWGMQSVREQAAAAETARGQKVVVAVNADFYNMGTGEPTGSLVMNGNVKKEHRGELLCHTQRRHGCNSLGCAAGRRAGSCRRLYHNDRRRPYNGNVRRLRYHKVSPYGCRHKG